MIATRLITRQDIVRAAQINDAVAEEYEAKGGEGADVVGEQLGISVLDTAVFAAQHAIRRVPHQPTHTDALEATTHAFTMGALVALRAVEVVGR